MSTILCCDECGEQIDNASDCLHAHGLDFCCEQCLLWYENMTHSCDDKAGEVDNNQHKELKQKSSDDFSSDDFDDWRNINALIKFIRETHQPWELFAIAEGLLFEVADNAKGFNESIDITDLNDDFMALIKKYFKPIQENENERVQDL